MFDCSSALLQKIHFDEGSLLEFKEVHFEEERIVGPQGDVLADVLAAMANGSGGTYALGVEDSMRRVRGVPAQNLDLIEAFVSELANDSQ